MQTAAQTLLSYGIIIGKAVLKHVPVVRRPVVTLRLISSFSSVHLEERGFESTTVADILKAKGKYVNGSSLWCTTDNNVYDAVQLV